MGPKQSKGQESARETASLSEVFLERPRPALLERYLEGSGLLEWYRIPVRLADSRIDPIFRIIAAKTPGRELLLGAGSDVVQLLMGVPKQLRDGAVSEINCIMDKDLPPVELFKVFENVSYPAFRGREAGKTAVVLNWESTIDLMCIIENAKKGEYILKDTSGRLNNLLKHTAVIEIPAEGQAYIYFRTPEDFHNFVKKKLSLPEISIVSPRVWLSNLDPETAAQSVQYVLEYAATIYERAKPAGWSFDNRSLFFLKSIAHALSAEEKEQCRQQTITRFIFTKTPAPTIFETFEELGLTEEEFERRTA